MGLIPLLFNGTMHPLPAKNAATDAIVVIRAGTYDFLVTAPNLTPGTYTLTTALTPNPRLLCAPTDAMTGVNFNTAITTTCALGAWRGHAQDTR